MILLGLFIEFPHFLNAQSGPVMRIRFDDSVIVEPTDIPVGIKGIPYISFSNDAKNGMFPGAPSSAFYAMGVGTQIIYIDPENELVIVARWIEKDKMPDFVSMVLASIKN